MVDPSRDNLGEYKLTIRVSPAVKAVAFVLIAAALLWFGLDYNAKADRRTASDAAKQAENAAAEQARILAALKKEDVKMGKGPEAKPGDSLKANYVGTLDDGTKFDSSYDRKEPIQFTLGAKQVIPGWDLGLIGMKAGGTRKLTVPPELAYGGTGAGPIPPNATLHFTIELLKIESPPPPVPQ